MSFVLNVALADDHVLIRKALASMLKERDFNIILQADNGREFIEHLNPKQLPDILLLDINMPVMDGYATAQWIRANHPQIKILALSVLADEEAIIRMLNCGARGYILKDCEPEELAFAIRSVADKGYYHSELVSSKLMDSLQNTAANRAGSTQRVELTEKELQFLRLNCSEMTYKEIAQKLQLSPRTIDGYRDMLFEKLGIRSRVGLVLYAIKNHIVQI